MAVHSILSGTQWDGNTKGTLAEAYKYKIVLKPVGQHIQYIKAMHIIPHTSGYTSFGPINTWTP